MHKAVTAIQIAVVALGLGLLTGVPVAVVTQAELMMASTLFGGPVQQPNH